MKVKQSVHLKIMLVMLNLQALSIIMIVPNPSLTVFPVRQMTETEIDGIVFHFFFKFTTPLLQWSLFNLCMLHGFTIDR